MLRASTQQIHCEAAVLCVSCKTEVLNCKCLATLAIIAPLRSGFRSFPYLSPMIFASLDIAREFQATSTVTLKFFKSRVSQLLQRG